MKAFMSYQTADKAVAARVAALLKSMSVDAFMAHEDIDVSHQWRAELLRQLKLADVFIVVLSANYLTSAWCVQESGIAAFRKLTIIPLSADGTIPPGFLGEFQSIRIDPNNPTLANLLPGLANHDVVFTIDKLVEKFGHSGSYRTAEDNFRLLEPFLDRASKKQKVRLLTLSAHNSQIFDAGGCHTYLPPLVKTHGKFMPPNDLAKLKQEFSKYNIQL
jgi:hypothetical protein